MKLVERLLAPYWRWRWAREVRKAPDWIRGSLETEGLDRHELCPVDMEACWCAYGCGRHGAEGWSADEVERARASKVRLGRYAQLLRKLAGPGWDGLRPTAATAEELRAKADEASRMVREPLERE